MQTKNRQNSSMVIEIRAVVDCGGGTDWKGGHKGTFWGDWDTVKIHLIAHLRSVLFTPCKFYLNLKNDCVKRNLIFRILYTKY